VLKPSNWSDFAQSYWEINSLKVYQLSARNNASTVVQTVAVHVNRAIAFVLILLRIVNTKLSIFRVLSICLQETTIDTPLCSSSNTGNVVPSP
jgi:hypothetical protein